LQLENKEFTATSLHDRVANRTTKKTVGELFKSQIANLKQAGRTGYALSHQEAYNSLMKFNRHLDIYFSEVDIAGRFLRRNIAQKSAKRKG
jgi:hypothetical protein